MSLMRLWAALAGPTLGRPFLLLQGSLKEHAGWAGVCSLSCSCIVHAAPEKHLTEVVSHVTPFLHLSGTPELWRRFDAGKAREIVDALFVFALAQSIAVSAGTVEGRAAFTAFLTASFNGTLADYKAPSGRCLLAS